MVDTNYNSPLTTEYDPTEYDPPQGKKLNLYIFPLIFIGWLFLALFFFLVFRSKIPTFKDAVDKQFQSPKLHEVIGSMIFVYAIVIVNSLFVIWYQLATHTQNVQFKQYIIRAGWNTASANLLIGIPLGCIIGGLEQIYTILYNLILSDFFKLPFKKRLRMVMLARYFQGWYEYFFYLPIIIDMSNSSNHSLKLLFFALYIRLGWVLVHTYLGYLHVTRVVPRYVPFLIHMGLNFVIPILLIFLQQVAGRR
jgi:hypothetical protein